MHEREEKGPEQQRLLKVERPLKEVPSRFAEVPGYTKVRHRVKNSGKNGKSSKKVLSRGGLSWIPLWDLTAGGQKPKS